MKKALAFLVATGLALTVVGCSPMGSVPETSASDTKELIVAIGTSASSAMKAHKHNLSIEALNEGQTEYEVYTSASHSYHIMLSEQEIKDILDGTTVITETQTGDMKVKVRVKEKRRRSWGW